MLHQILRMKIEIIFLYNIIYEIQIYLYIFCIKKVTLFFESVTLLHKLSIIDIDP